MSPGYGDMGSGDPLTEQFWSFVRDGELKFQECEECGYSRWPAADTCPECLSRSFEWQDSAGEGTVWSFCTYVDPLYSNEVAETPYTLVAVTMDEGPFLQGILVGPVEDAAVGKRVIASAQTKPTGRAQVTFSIVAAGGGQS
jgi:uncharacterized OB-fold protein